MVKETYILEPDKSSGSVYRRLCCKSEHNYSAILVDGDVTWRCKHDGYYDTINIHRYVYGATLPMIEKFGGLYSIIYVKEEWKTYIVYRSYFPDSDLHSKELRDKFLNAVRGCSSILKEEYSPFDIVELKHYLAVIPEGCMCKHCYKINSEDF